MRDFGDDVFEGTARYYAKYRPQYPTQLLNDIARRFELSGNGRLLDLGCGTGELSIPLSKYFGDVIAMDPDQQMLNIGHKKATNLNIGNIKWQKGSSKTISGLKGGFRLVCMGQSFHWMDQESTILALYELLMPNGGIVIIGSEPTQQNDLITQKNIIVKNLINKYLGPGRRAGHKLYLPPDKKYYKVLADANFVDIEEKVYKIKVAQNIDEIVGQLFSMSWAAKKHFNEHALEFENELKDELSRISNGHKFIENVRFIMHTATK
jgi:ubiquinone/menaquinone biosynthesis C-methylase UbiE